VRRVYLDANVLFTAAHSPSGKAALVIELGKAGHWRLCTSIYAVEEARHNLAIKFPAGVQTLANLVQGIAVIQHDPAAECPVKLPEKDRPIFLAAMKCKATHLLTGDLPDFGPLMNQADKTGGITIQTVAAFLASI
jgi:predicted nucleic acid-binding protein